MKSSHVDVAHERVDSLLDRKDLVPVLLFLYCLVDVCGNDLDRLKRVHDAPVIGVFLVRVFHQVFEKEAVSLCRKK